MPRHARVAPGGMVYHALNRANGRNDLFRKPEDFAAFEQIMIEAMHLHPTRLLGYCLMRDHWHLVLWPRRDGEMSAFLRWLTMTHSQRLHARRHTTGRGHVYQGRYKSFPVQPDDSHLVAVLRYVEQNPLRSRMVKRAQDWQWSSLWRRRSGDEEGLLSEWPIDLPADWVRRVNAAQSAAELEALRRSVNRGAPYGADAWRDRIVRKLGLEHTLRSRGRPKKLEL